MKTNIHPDVQQIKISCSCGFEFNAEAAVKEDVKVEICSHCHPFYTGEQRILKTGAVDKFYARMKKADALKK